jgi:hypothetical protein
MTFAARQTESAFEIDIASPPQKRHSAGERTGGIAGWIEDEEYALA